MNDRLYFRQLLAGEDFAGDDALARSMRNFTYVIGDHETGDAMLVDPAYAPEELVDLVEREGFELVGVAATHYHPDHVGGELMGATAIAGVAELLASRPVPVHAQREEVEWLVARASLEPGVIVAHDDGDVVRVGTVPITLLHTPGHTPGSQCLLVEGRLVSGDTLFIEGCGRTDFPGGDAREMYRTLHERLTAVPDEVVLYPGHWYAPERSLAMGEVRRRNAVFAPDSLEGWLAAFGS